MTMNSFEFKPPKDRQTDTGDSGEAPQHFPIENFFFDYDQFFYFKPPHTDRQTHNSKCHVQTDKHTETGFYSIDNMLSHGRILISDYNLYYKIQFLSVCMSVCAVAV